MFNRLSSIEQMTSQPNSFEAQIKQGLLLRLGRRAAVIEPGLRDAIIGKAFDRIGPAGFYCNSYILAQLGKGFSHSAPSFHFTCFPEFVGSTHV